MLREGPALPSSHPLLAPASLKTHGPCSSSSFQATDEDSPPNNQITYSIVNASAFGSYFDISVYEGYGGMCRNEGPAWGRRVDRWEQGCTSHLSQEGALLPSRRPGPLGELPHSSCRLEQHMAWGHLFIGSRSVSPISQIFELSFVASWAS